MKTHPYTVISAVVGLFLPSSASAYVLLVDDFSSGTTTPDFRVYENKIDLGWHKAIGYGAVMPSEWDISGGNLSNASTVSGSGYPTTQPSEAPVGQILSNALSSDPASSLTISFDYDVAPGDTLYAHFWGYTGTATGTGFVSNIEAGTNGAANDGQGGGGSTLQSFNLTDGAASGFGSTASSISGALTGSGQSTTIIDIPALGIPGVSTLSDLDYFYIGFAKNEDGLAGTTSIDNLVIRVPEPSRTVLLGLGLGVVCLTRKR